jgi:processive 1,2-diacylglycerol beta-glucosyltransferase
VVQPYPLHEEANANYLLEHGAGMRIEPLTLLNHKLKSFFEDTAKRRNMRAAALKLAKPEAARTVVQSLLKQPL